MKKLISLFLALTMVATLFTVTVSAEETLTATATVECEENVTVNGSSEISTQTSAAASGGKRLQTSAFPIEWTITPAYTGTVDIDIVIGGSDVGNPADNVFQTANNSTITIDGETVFTGKMSGWGQGTTRIAEQVEVVKGVPFKLKWMTTVPNGTATVRPDCFTLTYNAEIATTVSKTERIEAETNFIENAAYSASNSIVTGAKYSGGGFLRRDGHKPQADWPFQVNFTAKHTGPHTFVLKHGGDGAFGNLSNVVKVGDTQIYTGKLTANGEWKPTVETTVGTTDLVAGQTYTFTWYMTGTGESTVSVDYVDVKWTERVMDETVTLQNPVTERIEAETNFIENAAYSASNSIVTGAKYSGGGYLRRDGHKPQAEWPFQVNFTAKHTGPHTFVLKHGGDGDFEKLSNVVKVGDTQIYTGTLTANGRWSPSVETTVGTTDLVAGQTYTFTWYMTGTGASTVSVDYVDVKWTEEISGVQASTSGSATDRYEAETNFKQNAAYTVDNAVVTDSKYSGGGYLYRSGHKPESGWPFQFDFTAKVTGPHSFAVKYGADESETYNMSSNKNTITVGNTTIFNDYLSGSGTNTPILTANVGKADLVAGQTYTFKWYMENNKACGFALDYVDITYGWSDSMYADVALINNATGEEVYGMDELAAGTYYAKVYATEWTSAMAPVLYAAVYDSTGALSDVKTVDVVSGDTVQTGTITVADGGYIMLYIWNDGNLQPLTGRWIFK